MNENLLIAQLTQTWKTDPTVLQGVGDDCAVLRGGVPRQFLLFKTDAVVEGHHFTPKTPARLVGRKALARVLSDFAAMGGKPLHALVTLGVPRSYTIRRLQGIYQGLQELAEQYETNLVGGETTRTKELLLSISALGETRGYSPVLRSGAKVGDHLLVTGTLGHTRAGKHLKFTPRLREGQWLAKNRIASAMMDLSDGLGTDLPRLATRSGVGFKLDPKNLPRTRGASWHQACSDGEDYELLFTVSPKKIVTLRKSWPFSTKLTEIGQMVPLSLNPKDPLNIPHGFDHLRNS